LDFAKKNSHNQNFYIFNKKKNSIFTSLQAISSSSSSTKEILDFLFFLRFSNFPFRFFGVTAVRDNSACNGGNSGNGTAAELVTSTRPDEISFWLDVVGDGDGGTISIPSDELFNSACTAQQKSRRMLAIFFQSSFLLM
jgi:hypothetical protein